MAFFVSLCVVFACTTQPPTAYPLQASPNLVAELEAETVALYLFSAPDRPICTGVWIGSHAFITAQHCTSDDEKDSIVYSVLSEHRGVAKVPLALHETYLVREDKEHKQRIRHAK